MPQRARGGHGQGDVLAAAIDAAVEAGGAVGFDVGIGEEEGVGPRCCAPTGCLHGAQEAAGLQKPKRVDPNSEDAVRVTCNNEQCPLGSFMHRDCFETWERGVLQHLRGTGRARGWSERQRLQNLWTRKGYDLAFKACGCKCGRGHLKKDLDWVSPSTQQQQAAGCGNNGEEGAGAAEETKKRRRRRNRQNNRPTLGVVVHHHHIVDNGVETRARAGSLSSSTASGSPPPASSSSASPSHGGKKKSKFDFFSDRSRCVCAYVPIFILLAITVRRLLAFPIL
ncbi:hypothetical protein J437_LFUL004456 [Ladona fulva]|uniref:Headcase N-terminal domain-containing protein n=1 Tax=Ladona fulva TaxID=123851 RepID=A0A8K0NUV0_LADFU|nr:hypothetical protein J437_LFUL004456 [Ladona fulva]